MSVDDMNEPTQKMVLIGELMTTIRNQERERCAKIAEDYAKEHAQGVGGSMAEEMWGLTHGQRIAKLIRGDHISITCPHCGMTSHNINDVRNRYCGNCHIFLEVS